MNIINLKPNPKMNAIAIIGPNGVGKTSVAFEVARRIKGEIINLDKIYTFKGFPISSGLSDTLKEKGVKKRLYELLEPDQEIIHSIDYAKKVHATCIQIMSRGNLPIIEGGSTTYFPSFYENNKNNKFCKIIIGLKFPRDFDIKKKIIKRLEAALKEGLLEEVKKGVVKYKDSLIINDAHFVVPLTKYLNGNTTLEKAKEEIVDRCFNYANQQMALFNQYKEIIWIEHDLKSLTKTVKKILTLIEQEKHII